ncbi:MAG: hypothetical protein PHT60_11710 [Acidiphilium sp.]|nr:hypothetical protein [Acidiphilium sp.]MDD4936429.1 hypothetical protein [Acidiphilium sp.]
MPAALTPAVAITPQVAATAPVAVPASSLPNAFGQVLAVVVPDRQTVPSNNSAPASVVTPQAQTEAIDKAGTLSGPPPANVASNAAANGQVTASLASIPKLAGPTGSLATSPLDIGRPGTIASGTSASAVLVSGGSGKVNGAITPGRAKSKTDTTTLKSADTTAPASPASASPAVTPLMVPVAVPSMPVASGTPLTFGLAAAAAPASSPADHGLARASTAVAAAFKAAPAGGAPGAGQGMTGGIDATKAATSLTIGAPGGSSRADLVPSASSMTTFASTQVTGTVPAANPAAGASAGIIGGDAAKPVVTALAGQGGASQDGAPQGGASLFPGAMLASAQTITVPALTSGSAVASASASVPATQAATAQVTAAMVGVGPIPVTGGATVAGGTRLTIAMAPPAIGMVNIQIDSGASGASVIAVGATHPATLAALQNDHAALEQMLTQAGVPIDHRSITFHLEPVRSDTGNAAGQVASGQSSLGASGGGLGQGAGQQSGGQPGNSGGGQTAQSATQAYDRRGITTEATVVPDGIALQSPIPMRRFGINMMA